MSELVGPGSKYTDQQRLHAVAEYCSSGNTVATSKATGIPRGTLQGWTETDWWVEEVSKIQHEISEQIQAQNMQIATKAGEQILDRIENGDTVVVKGEKIKIPVRARDLSVVSGIAVDKTIQLGMPKSVDLGKTQTIEELCEIFRKIARQDTDEARVVSNQ